MLVCGACGDNWMKVVESVELGPTAADDEYALQILACVKCDVRAIGLYTESRRGAFGSESVHHFGYPVDRATASALLQVLNRGDGEAIRAAFAPHMDETKRFRVVYRDG